MNFEKCTETIHHKIITVAENKRKFTIENNNAKKVNRVFEE